MPDRLAARLNLGPPHHVHPAAVPEVHRYHRRRGHRVQAEAVAAEVVVAAVAAAEVAAGAVNSL